MSMSVSKSSPPGVSRDGSGDDILGEKELELLVGELAQLGAQHVVDADMVRISSAPAKSSAVLLQPARNCNRNCGFGGTQLTTGTQQ